MGLNEFLSKLFGNKAQRDIKQIQPYVDKVKEVYPTIQRLTNDELRNRTSQIRSEIREYVSSEKKKIDELRNSIEGLEIESRESTYAQIV